MMWWINPPWRLLLTASFLLCSTCWSSGVSYERSLGIFIPIECKSSAFAWQLLGSQCVCSFSMVHEPLIQILCSSSQGCSLASGAISGLNFNFGAITVAMDTAVTVSYVGISTFDHLFPVHNFDFFLHAHTYI